MLILSGSPNSYSIKRLIEEAKKKNHEVEVISPIDFFAYISPIQSGHDRIYLKTPDNETKRVLSKYYDVVIPRFAGGSFEFSCSIVEHLSENMGIATTSSASGLRIASNKLATSQRLSARKIRTVKSVFAHKPNDFKQIITLLDGLPIVCKTLTGSMGNGVFILNDELSASTTLGALSKLEINLILQKFINSGEPKTDLRIYIVDKKISGAYKRFALDTDFRSNYSISKHGEMVTLTEEEKQMAIDAAIAVGLPGVCAVDIIRDFDNNNRPYVIEVNGNGNLRGIEAVTKNNIAGDIIEYAERIAGKSANNSNSSNNSSAIVQEIVDEDVEFCKTHSIADNVQYFLKKKQALEKTDLSTQKENLINDIHALKDKYL